MIQTRREEKKTIIIRQQQQPASTPHNYISITVEQRKKYCARSLRVNSIEIFECYSARTTKEVSTYTHINLFSCCLHYSSARYDLIILFYELLRDAFIIWVYWIQIFISNWCVRAFRLATENSIHPNDLPNIFVYTCRIFNVRFAIVKRLYILFMWKRKKGTVSIVALSLMLLSVAVNFRSTTIWELGKVLITFSPTCTGCEATTIPHLVAWVDRFCAQAKTVRISMNNIGMSTLATATWAHTTTPSSDRFSTHRTACTLCARIRA